MAILDIAQLGDPALRVPAQTLSPDEVKSEAVQTFIDDLIDTMRNAKGAGLAATQVRKPWSICVIEVGDNPRYPYKPKIPLTILVNPVLTPITEDMFDNYEGCLSVPNLRGVVPRYVGLRVQALDRNAQPMDYEVWGLSAGTYQHECDHLDGKLFVDNVQDTKTLCTWEEFDRHHRAAFILRVEALVKKYGA